MHVESAKTDIDDLLYKAEIEIHMQRTNIWIPRGEGAEGRIDFDIYTLCRKYITNKNLLCSAGNSTPCLW